MAEIDSLTIVLAAVTRGMGITVLPEGAVPADGGLRAAPFADAWRTLSVCWREPLAPSSARALRTLRELAAVLAPGGDG
jgi:DNA-binding transcriptional LysR family regulator